MSLSDQLAAAINATKARIDERTNVRRGPSVMFWRPSAGKNRIRIMPAWTNEGFHAGIFWREVAQHWGLSDELHGPVLCAKQTPGIEGECPACDLVARLRSEKSLRAGEVAKDIRAKRAYLLNVVDLDDAEFSAKEIAEWTKANPGDTCPFKVGDTKVQVYAAPGGVFNSLLTSLQANQTDFTDLEKGHDIVIERAGKGLTTKYTVNPILAPSAAPAFQELPPLDQVGYTLAPEKLMEVLSNGVGGEFAALLGAGGSMDMLTSGDDPQGSADPVEEQDLRKQLSEALRS